MKSWSRPRTRVVLLAILLGLGMSLSFVQGSVMAGEMVAAADGSHNGPRHCDGCRGDDKGMDVGICLAVCGSTAQVMLPGELVAAPPASRASFEVARLVVGGRSHTPDHGPPKTLALG